MESPVKGLEVRSRCFKPFLDIAMEIPTAEAVFQPSPLEVSYSY
jgi:hypothetical protein